MSNEELDRGAPPTFPASLEAGKGSSRVASTDDRIFLAVGVGALVLTIGYAVACVLEAGHPATGLVISGIVAAAFIAFDRVLVRGTVVSLVLDGAWVGVYRGRRLSTVIPREALRAPVPRAHTRFEDDDLHAMRAKLVPAKHIMVSAVALLFSAGIAVMGLAVTDRDDGRLLLFWSGAVCATAAMWLHGSIRVGVLSRRIVLDQTDPEGVMFSKSDLERMLDVK